MSATLRFPVAAPALRRPAAPPKLVARARAIPASASAELAALVPRWRDLVAHAAEPNVFHDPWMLLPALAHLAGGAEVDVVVVEGADPARPHEAPALLALVPVERVRRWRGLPIAARVLWWFRHTYLGTPLVRAGHARAALAALLDFAAGEASLLELRGVRADGAVAEALVELCCARGLDPVISGRHTRALLVPGDDAERYLEAAISPGRRKELRRQERRLAELGALSYTLLDARDDPGAALAELLALEAAGWKGRDGGALGCDPADRRFFEAACRAAHAEGRLILTALRVGGRAVAAKCSFLAVPGAFAFKIAYDERCARFSPGVLLELDHVRRLHARPDVAWMDSCAAWDHPMINGLWSERRTLETVLLAPGGGPLPRVVAAATPLLRLGARLLGRRSS